MFMQIFASVANLLMQSASTSKMFHAFLPERIFACKACHSGTCGRKPLLRSTVQQYLSCQYKAALALCGQGIEIGSGFSGSRMLGSEHNDEFYMDEGEVRTRTNRC